MKQKRYLCIKNFDEAQHYKDRNPIWIKVQCALLDDYDFGQLPDETRFHALALTLLAARMNNRLPDDAAWLSRRVSSSSEINLELLLEIGFLEVLDGDDNDAETPDTDDENVRTDAETPEKKSASATSETVYTTKKSALAQNRTEQKRKEQNTTQQNTTQQNTTEQTRSREKALDAENRVAVVAVGDVLNSFENQRRPESAEKPSPAARDASKAEAATKGAVTDPVAKRSADSRAAPMSEFSLEDCLKYVQICQNKGDSVRNPQGLANHLYQTGKSDAFIRAALYPVQQAEIEKEISGEPVKFSDEPCKVCFGAKMELVPGKGARPCTHCLDERGKRTGREPLTKEISNDADAQNNTATAASPDDNAAANHHLPPAAGESSELIRGVPDDILKTLTTKFSLRAAVPAETDDG